jgi:hypothetical protein
VIIAELIEQLSKMDLTLTVYVETDNEVGPVHTIDVDQFDENGVPTPAVVLVATEPDAPGGPIYEFAARHPSAPEVRPAGGAGDGHDYGDARS